MARKPTGGAGASEVAGPGDRPKHAPRRKASKAAETSPPEPEAAQVDPPPSENSAGVQWERLWSIFRVVIDSTAFIGAVGFVLSLILNAIVFGMWGINYFQVAAAEDVILSGIMIAVFLIAIIIAMTATTFVLLNAVMFLRDRMEGWPSLLRQVVSIIVYVTVALLVLLPNRHRIANFMDSDDIPANEIVVVTGLGFYCASILIMLFPHIRRSANLLRIFISVFLAFSVALALYVALAIGKVGMHALTPIIYKEASCAKGEPALVLWSGRDRFVYRCPDGKIVVAKQENFEFEVRR